MRYFEKRPMIMILIGILGISMSSILIRYSTAPSAVTASWRLIWTVLLLTPAVFGGRENRKELFGLQKKALLMSVVSGIFLAIHFWFWFESLTFTTVASATTIVSTEVIWVSLGFFLFLKGKLSRKAMAAIGVAFVGTVCIAFADSGTGGTHLKGDFLALLAAVAVAVYMLLGRVVRSQVSNTVYTYVVYFACAAGLLMMSVVQQQGLFAYGWNGILIGLALAVFSTILGHSVFSWCLKFFSPSFVSACKLCEPVVSATMAAFLFREIPGPVQLLGCLLILGSVLYYSRLEEK
ncbi:MAG: DMT family transporter [Oscillospiraceae bacterium]|nr:DMT family transporter [Oscillospiraceae bacterium]